MGPTRRPADATGIARGGSAPPGLGHRPGAPLVAWCQALLAAARGPLGWGAGLAALLGYPLLDRALNLQTLNAATDAAVFVVLALGLNIVVGYAGLLDLGYAAFFAIGAYATGIFTWPRIVPLP